MRIRLSENDIKSTMDLQNNSCSCLDDAIEKVMCSYQNANKWLDTIKECVLMDIGCVFFSDYLHNLAHTMPERFDKFGDILHTEDMKVPYPTTNEIDEEPTDITSVFEKVFCILDCIKCSLSEFIDCTEECGYNSMKISAEGLLEDISTEYTNLKRMERTYQRVNDEIEFDKWVEQYVNNLDSLLD